MSVHESDNFDDDKSMPKELSPVQNWIHDNAEIGGFEGNSDGNKYLDLKLQEMKIQQLDREIELERLRLRRIKIDNSHEASASTASDVRTTLPKIEIPRFNGDPSRYWLFIKSFIANIESRLDDDVMKLTYLIQYCEGEARECIEECIVMGPKEGYTTAKELLRTRFGQNHMIASAHMDKLLKGPPVPSHDPIALLKLAQQMSICERTLEQLNYKSSIDAETTIETIVRRLPVTLQHKWSKIANFAVRENREPTFKELREFVTERAEIANTKYGMIASASEAASKRGISLTNTLNSKQTTNRGMVHVTAVTDAPTSTNTLLRKCPICSDVHFTDQCRKFINAPVWKRKEMVVLHKLCNVCLKPNHMAKDCRVKRYCTAEGCGRPHHRLLHTEIETETSPTMIRQQERRLL